MHSVRGRLYETPTFWTVVVAQDQNWSATVERAACYLGEPDRVRGPGRVRISSGTASAVRAKLDDLVLGEPTRATDVVVWYAAHSYGEPGYLVGPSLVPFPRAAVLHPHWLPT